MPKSRKHHFVSQHHIKSFTETENKIFVYDKILNKFYENNPLNLFANRDRNTFINTEGVEDDVIERMYASLENTFHPTLTEIINTGSVSGANYKVMLFFAYISKWRVPQYDESFSVAQKAFSMKDLGFGIKDENGQEIDFDLEEISESSLQQEIKRFLLPFQPFRFKQDYAKLLAQSFILPTPGFFSFISDCPFVEAIYHESDEIFEDFIFPITKDLTLVYSSRINREDIADFLNNGQKEITDSFIKNFSIARDIALLEIADRQVACGDQDRIIHIVNSYNDLKRVRPNINYSAMVFEMLYDWKSQVE